MAKRAKKKAVVTKSEKAKEPEASSAPESTTITETTAAPKQRGRKSPYDAETKSAILKAAADARDAGKSWADAWDAAKAAGYKGSLQYLMKTARDSGAVKVRARRKRRKTSAAPVAMSAKRKPGRPAKVAAVAHAGGGLGDIEKIVSAMVEVRVAAAIGQAVAAPKKAVASPELLWQPLLEKLSQTCQPFLDGATGRQGCFLSESNRYEASYIDVRRRGIAVTVPAADWHVHNDVVKLIDRRR